MPTDHTNLRRRSLRNGGRVGLLAAVLAVILGLTVPAAQAADSSQHRARVESGTKLIGEPVLLPYDGKGRGVPAAKLKPKGAPLSPEEAGRQALAEARTRNEHSYYDTSKVPLSADGKVKNSVQPLAQPPTTWGEEPPPDAQTCLDRDQAASAEGETYNRWLWCAKYRLGIDYYTVDSDGKRTYHGTASVAYHAVVVGSGQTRAVRTYFQAQQGSVDYSGWVFWDPWRYNVPDLSMYVLTDCVQSTTYCHAAGSGIEHTWDEWDYHHEWLYWDVYSHKDAATNNDKVLFHQWHFRFGGSGGGYAYSPGATPDRTIRCDSANYFSQFGVEYPDACINYEVVPHLQYKISDTRVSSVARHIRDAQNNPTRTYPIEFHEKVIPGKYSGNRDDAGLHRVPEGSPTARANEDMRLAACNRTAPYEDWRGLPPYDTSTKDCDEYPFRSTEEGAANPHWDFSVRAVPNTENRSAGGLLINYYFEDRILYGSDAFWVEIND
jgi:hypothetical protein